MCIQSVVLLVRLVVLFLCAVASAVAKSFAQNRGNPHWHIHAHNQCSSVFGCCTSMFENYKHTRHPYTYAYATVCLYQNNAKGTNVRNSYRFVVCFVSLFFSSYYSSLVVFPMDSCVHECIYVCMYTIADSSVNIAVHNKRSRNLEIFVQHFVEIA